MPRYETNFRSLPIHSQTLNPVLAFQPHGTTRSGSSSSPHGRRYGNPPHGATVLPFVLPRSSTLAQPVLTRPQPASLIAREQEYRQRMFENVLAAVWVGTLMSAGYWMLKVLAAPSMF